MGNMNLPHSRTEDQVVIYLDLHLRGGVAYEGPTCMMHDSHCSMLNAHDLGKSPVI